MNKNILKHIIRYLLMICIVVICSTIFKFSSDISTKSSGKSIKMSGIVIDIFGNGRNMSEEERMVAIKNIEHIIRKLAHFSIYFLLGMFLMLTAGTFKWENCIRFDVSVLFALVYAMSDEFHQLFVSGRSCEFRDVCIDTIGASFGTLLVLVIFILVKKVQELRERRTKRLAEKNIDTGIKRKVLFIASTGGHLNELMQIRPIFKKYDYHIVTEKTKVDESLKEKYGDRISFLIYGTKKYPIKYIFKFFANCFISLYYFFKYQPEVIVTTGTHTAVPMCYIAKIFGSKVIFIETFANRTTATVAGKLVYHIADTFVVQWEEMHKIYPKSVCWGWLY